MKKNIHIFFLFFFLLVKLTGYSQVPDDYYDSADGLTGDDLKQELHDIITDGHDPISYDDLWTAFQSTDVDNYYEDDGSVMDMYSENPSGSDSYNYEYTSDQCETYQNEGDCYNREHSFPKSWWGSSESEPQYSDLNHIFPTDGYVNNRRSSYPFGVVGGTADWVSDNGCRLGANTYGSDYSGTVFEPLDEFKGDFARAYFYMATRYKDEIPTWVSDNSGSGIEIVFQADGSFQPWYYDMLYEWHENDPVSQKEKDRDDEVYYWQSNANPYITHPEWVCEVFGTCTVNPEPDNYPADFTATAVSSSQIDLSWTDATGTNLPDYYLIKANTTGSFTDPVDGTDPAADSDLSDGEALIKIPQGSKGAASFTGLSASTTYYFKIWSYANTGTDIDFKTDGTAPEVNATTNDKASETTLIDEDFSNCPPTGWIQYSVSGDEVWGCDNGYEEINAYGDNEADNDWLITPSMDFSNLSNGVLTFSAYTKYSDSGVDDPEVRVKYSTDYPGSGNPEDYTWTELSYSYPAEDSQTWTSSGSVDLSSITGSSVYIAFQYTSSGTSGGNAALWEIDDVLITAETSGPSLASDPASLSGFSYIEGNGPSASQTFDLSGSDLDGSDVTLTAPSNFEISSDDASYSGSITLSAYDGTTTTFYARMISGLSTGSYSGNITVSGGGASDITVALDGDVSDGSSPELFISEIAGKGYEGDYNDEYIEISNTGGTSADLTDWTVEYYEGSTLEATFDITGTLNANDAYVIAIRTTYNDITPDFVPSQSYSINNDCYVILKENGNVKDQAGSSSDLFNDANNYEFTDCSNDNLPVANWDNLSANNGTPGIVNCNTNPSLVLSPTSLTGFSYIEGNGPSASQTFDLSGSNLDGSDVTLTAPSNFEISSDDASYSGSITLSAYDGTTTTFYARMISGLSTGSYSGNITVSGGGASDVYEALDGEVLEPELTVSPASLSGLSYYEGNGPSASQTFDLSGSNLDGSDVTLTAPSNFEISSDDASYSGSITLSAYDGTTTTFYARMISGLSAGSYSGNITVSGGGASDITLNLSGDVLIPELISSKDTVFDLNYPVDRGPSNSQDFNLSGNGLDGTDVTLSAPADFEISTDNTAFSASVTLANFDGNSVTLYVRLKSGLAIGNYSGDIIISGGGASDIKVNLNGEVLDGCSLDLIISEYVEGSGNNKFIELYNGTGKDIDLDNYELIQYNSGGSEYSLSLSGTVSDGNVFVIENENEDLGVSADFSTSDAVMTFNGDDPVALRKNGSDIDIVGSNPGDNFGEDITLVRKPDVLDGAASYDASQWDSYGIDDVSHLGSHTMICTCEEPVVDASNLTFSNITVSSMDLSWTNGDGVSRIVIACEDSPVSFVPADNNTYTANSSFGSGTDLGSGNYCVYNGTGNSVTVTGLTPGTTYYFKIYEYGCQAGSEDYLTNGTPEEGNETTVPNDVSDFSVVCTTATTANLSWTLPEGNYDGIMIAVLEGATPDNPTCDGVTLTSADTDFSSASVYCSNASGAVYVYNDLGTSVTVTGLTSGNTYNFKAFVYKNGSWSAGNEIIQTAEVSDVSDLTSSCGNEESMIAWTNPSSACFDEVIIAVNTSSVSALPSGTYTANSLDYTDSSNPTLSDGSVVVYNGTSSPQTVTGLTNGTTYYFKVFVRSGSDWSAGKEVSCAATTASFFDYGDLAIVGINTHYIDSDASASDDEIQFVCFKDITTETSIDFTDNGYERLYAGKWGDSEGTITLTRTGPDVPAGTVITVRGKNQASNWHVFIGSGTPNGSLTDDDANWTITDGGTGNNVFDLNVNDQIWMMQGGTWDNPAGDHNATYSGKVLYGWTAIGWEDAPGYDDTKGSTIFPSSACSVTNLVGVDNEDKVRYNDDVTETTQREWISRFNDEQKWEGYTDSTAYQEGGTLPDVITVTGSGFSGTYQWTGDTSEDWDDCTNWLNLKVPDASADVIFVSDDCNNDLVIESGQTVACHNFTVSGTNPDHFVKLEGHSDAVMEIYGNLTIGGPAGVFDMDDGSSADDGTLKIYGDFIENTAGGFSDGNSLVEFCGSSEQSVSTAGSTLNFYNLTLNNTSAGGLVSGSSLQINGTLNLESGIFNLNGYDLTLSGDFSGINGVFAGNQSSNITVNGSGTLDYNFSFAVPQELNSFTLDRDSESAVFATDLTLGSLQIDAGTVELETGKYYTVTGNIVNTPGTSGLILKSDATGTASLIQNNENIEATCERYIPGNVWSYLFSPLDDVSSSLFTSGNPNVFYYDESTDDYWDATTIYGTTGWVPVTGTLSIDKGFINYYNTSKVYELTGGNLYYDATNKNKVFTLTYNDSGSGSVNENGVTADWDNFEGWNLIGNPYTSAVDWDQVTLSDVENIIYYYDGAAANYKYYGTGGDAYDQGITVNGGSQFIPANQGVFVKAINDGGTVTIPDAARVHNAQAFWKKQTKVPADILRLQIEQNGFVDETVVRIIDEATEDHDAKYDAYKFFSLDNTKPMLYSRNFENTRNFAVNSIPEFGSEKVIPLGMYIGTDDEYKIKMTENRFDKMHIYLQDKDLSEYVNLVTNPEYTFYQNATDFSDRFSLNFKKNTPPVLNANIPDQFITKGETYNYVIPSDIFADSDQGDILYTSATSEDGSALPAWISYDAETMTFTGVPDSEQVLNIKITAEDIFGETVSDTYKLTVTSNSEINTFEEMRFNIYPNPTDGKFVAEFNYPADATVSVTDISGKEILRKNMHSNIEYFDLSKYSKGIYIIKIKTDNLIINKRIILK